MTLGSDSAHWLHDTLSRNYGHRYSPDLGRAHGPSTGMHGCTNGLEVIEGSRAVECINQEVRDGSQLKLLQPER